VHNGGRRFFTPSPPTARLIGHCLENKGVEYVFGNRARLPLAALNFKNSQPGHGSDLW